MAREHRNWFARGGQAYARFRPDYPPELVQFLAGVAPDRRMAVDVGCGSGQLTCRLAACFEQVLGVDPSADQLAHATAHAGVEYVCASAELLPVAPRRASLITAAQAAHWFDLPRFYEEVRRIGAEHAVLALVSYGALRLDGAPGLRFERFYRGEIGPYWPAERKLVDAGYAGLDFPFDERPAPALEIRRAWNLEELLGYVCTWSAVRSAREAMREDILQRFAHDLAALWDDPASRREVRWPIRMRLGVM